MVTAPPASLPSTLHSIHTDGKCSQDSLLCHIVLTQLLLFYRPLKSGQHKSSKHSDQGYDSFSVSSSDSFPSAATSPSSKLSGQKLKQIPEDVHLLEMMNASSRNECDHLFAEMEILLRKSYEKEGEGDLRAAAALADSAASKARIAMDAPYSNHHTLIAAKMKYSMCVMRSTLLHRRVQEAEVEERRLMKASHDYNHSRQSSRDSTHGKHSRQGSRDGKDPRAGVVVSPPRQMVTSPVPNVEIYATLPKRGKRKSHLKTSNGNLTTEESSCQPFSSEQSTLPQSSILQQLQNEQRPAATVMPNTDKNLSKCKALSRESDFSDYYSEWEGTKRSERTLPLSGSSGWQSCRENDSEVYGEISHTGTARKQCKVKRKLLLGGLLKRQNRSLPDLSREETLLQEKSCPLNASAVNSVEESSRQSAVANIHRGFSKGTSRPSLLKVKPPLIGEMMAPKTAVSVAKECIYANVSQLQLGGGPNANYRVPPLQAPPKVPPRPQPPVPQVHCPKPVLVESELESVQNTNPFLLELNKKRIEILSKRKDNEALQVQKNVSNGPLCGHTGNSSINRNTASRVSGTLPAKKPSTREIASFISRTAAASVASVGKRSSPILDIAAMSEMKQRMAHLSVQTGTAPVDSSTIHMPIAVHANTNIANNMANTSHSRPVRPPDYETAMRRLELHQNDQRGNFLPPPPPQMVNQSCTKAAMPKVARQVSNSSLQLVDSCAASARAPEVRRKKKVSFSDQIEWVACSGDDPEVHLPNPLLEKVLSNKHIVYTLQ